MASLIGFEPPNRTSASNHDSICSTGNLDDLLRSGMPDSEVLAVWLGEMGFERYLPLFVSAG